MILRYAPVVILYSPFHSINSLYSQLRHILYILLPILHPELPLKVLKASILNNATGLIRYIYEQNNPIKNTFINTQNTIHKKLTDRNKGKESL